MQPQGKRGKMLVAINGYISCPRCRRNKRLYKIQPDDEAKRVTLFCRDCKQEITLTIEKGQCFESRSQ